MSPQSVRDAIVALGEKLDFRVLPNTEYLTSKVGFRSLTAQFLSKEMASAQFFFAILGPHPQHMEVPRLGVESELPLLAYATATATQDLSQVCDPHDSSRQRWILNTLRGQGLNPQSHGS